MAETRASYDGFLERLLTKGKVEIHEGFSTKAKKTIELTDSTRKAVKDYCNWLNAHGRTDGTITKNLYSLAVFLGYAGKKDVLKLGTKEIEAVIAQIQKSDYSFKTKMAAIKTAKQFYRLLVGEGVMLPVPIAKAFNADGTIKESVLQQAIDSAKKRGAVQTEKRLVLAKTYKKYAYA